MVCGVSFFLKKLRLNRVRRHLFWRQRPANLNDEGFLLLDGRGAGELGLIVTPRDMS